MNESIDDFKKRAKEKKNKKEEDKIPVFSLHKFLFSYVVKTLLVIVLFLGTLIFIKISDSNKQLINKYVYENNLSFARIYNVYQQYLGDIVPFKNTSNKTERVSSEKLSYTSVKKENNGYIFNGLEGQSVGSLKSGVVIEKKESKTYGNIIRIEDRNGLIISYGYISDSDIKLYEYVKKGEIIGSVKDKLYLIFEKNKKYLSYEKYL